jgi:hypothetical protein
VGVFNDGYLGSDTDLGTYRNREIETAWLNKQAETTLFGGEVTIPGSEFNKINYAAKEMFTTHTAYMNLYWNNKVIDEWKTALYTKECGDDELYYGKTAFEYIQNHLGYRFVLRKSDITKEVKKGEELSVSGTVENVGFGNAVKNKITELILKNEDKDEKYIFNMDIDVTKWLSRTKNEYLYKMNIPQDFPSGRYMVYLRIRTPSEIDTNYSIQFANKGIWNEAVAANYIGSTVIK